MPIYYETFYFNLRYPLDQGRQRFSKMAHMETVSYEITAAGMWLPQLAHLVMCAG